MLSFFSCYTLRVRIIPTIAVVLQFPELVLVWGRNWITKATAAACSETILPLRCFVHIHHKKETALFAMKRRRSCPLSRKYLLMVQLLFIESVYFKLRHKIR